MSLKKLTLPLSWEISPLVKEKILALQKIIQHPLLAIMWVSGAGKDKVIEHILHKDPSFTKMRRATTRPHKDRDNPDDFIYMNDEEMDKAILSGDVLSAYYSHRWDGTRYGLLYTELEKLAHHPMVTTLGLGWLAVKHYIPMIAGTIIRKEKDIVEGLGTRVDDEQTWFNIENLQANSNTFLWAPLKSQFFIENIKDRPDSTASGILDIFQHFERDIFRSHPTPLGSMFSIAVGQYMWWEDANLEHFRTNLVHFLTDEQWHVDKEKMQELYYFVLTQKFSQSPAYFNKMKARSDSYLIPKGEKKWEVVIYQATAQLLFDLWYIQEAKNILLQIGITHYPFRLRSQAPAISSQKIDIPHSLGKLSQRYLSSYLDKEGEKLIFIHNSFAFGWSATRLAERTLHTLLQTKNIKIHRTTMMWGTFEVELLEPHDGIKYIECQITKDRE